MRKLGLCVLAQSCSVPARSGRGPATIAAQSGPATGSLTGAVTADAGEVRALRVKATDTVNKISYTVFTKGPVQIRDLPASRYTVQIVEEEFEAPAQTVDVPAGAPQTVNLVLKHKQVFIQGAGAAGAAAQSNYGAVRVNPDGQSGGAPGLRRALSSESGTRRHGEGMLHVPRPDGLARVRSSFGAPWRRAVLRMFEPNAEVAGMAHGVPQTTYDRVSKEQAEKHHQVPDRELRARFEEARPEGRQARPRRGCAHPDRSTSSTRCPRHPRRVRAEGCLRRSANPIAALGLGQRRRSEDRLHVGESLRLDCRC